MSLQFLEESSVPKSLSIRVNQLLVDGQLSSLANSKIFYTTGLSNISGSASPLQLTPVQIVDNFLLYTTAANLTVNLPTVANLSAYVTSLGVPLTFNRAFTFTIINSSANTVSVSNNADPGWALASSQGGTFPYNIATATTVYFTVIFSSPSSCFLLV